MQHTICSDCYYCKTDRKNKQGQVRCTRFSRYVNENDKTCKEFVGKCLWHSLRQVKIKRKWNE